MGRKNPHGGTEARGRKNEQRAERKEERAEKNEERGRINHGGTRSFKEEDFEERETVRKEEDYEQQLRVLCG